MMLKNSMLVGILTVLCGMSMNSCSKDYQHATIDRDCTGTYLELNDKDYLVCNPDIVNWIEEGNEIQVKFKTNASCPQDPNQSLCELYHAHCGIVEILEIIEIQ